MRYLWSVIFVLFNLLLTQHITAQDVTLEYIFQDTNIINPRPSLKQINVLSNKIFYYGNDDFGPNIYLFDYNYITGETYKYSDTGNTPSEFSVLPNGDLLSVMDGDIFISKNFTTTREYTKDIQLTESEKYEYSPRVFGNMVIYRKAGNYFMLTFDSLKATSNELQLTSDESDSISYQIIAVTDNTSKGQTTARLLFARYNNSQKDSYLVPNYTRELVTPEYKRRGISIVKLLEYEIRKTPQTKTNKPDSLYSSISEIQLPESVRYFTQEAKYSPDAANIILDADAIDRHTRKIFNYEIAGKSIKEIYSESDTAWFERHSNSIQFINKDAFIFESEISGFNNIYRINKDGSGVIDITPGSFTVLESVVNRESGKQYFIANIQSPQNYFIYETSLEGGEPKQLTKDEGDIQNLSISPDGTNLFYEHSYINQPSELYMLNISTNTQTRITNTIPPKFSQVNWTIPELVKYNNEEDGQALYAFVYKPKDFNPKKKYPLLCFAHGAGYMQNVTNGFSQYRDNFMACTYWTSKDYVVLDLDYRGSLGYGKDFRTETNRNLGYWEVSDYISGVNYLNSLGYINKDKVGIYGGSYGGFVTLMALFKHPEIFKCGVALRAVSNWKYYYYSNWWFTAGRLGDYNDKDNAKYYDECSPITYAENLQVPLLLIHGMLDDNVFFQDMVQLTQKLIELKKDFDVMFYPKEYHGFHLQSSWLDQYKRIDKFFEKNLK